MRYMQVIKEEFSSSGLGVRVCRCLPDLACGTALERWVKSCLARDGVVTVEPWLDILVEFSAECVKQSATHSSAATCLRIEVAPTMPAGILLCQMFVSGQVGGRALERSVNATG
jgi:hypothetical protein